MEKSKKREHFGAQHRIVIMSCVIKIKKTTKHKTSKPKEVKREAKKIKKLKSEAEKLQALENGCCCTVDEVLPEILDSLFDKMLEIETDKLKQQIKEFRCILSEMMAQEIQPPMIDYNNLPQALSSAWIVFRDVSCSIKSYNTFIAKLTAKSKPEVQPMVEEVCESQPIMTTNPSPHSQEPVTGKPISSDITYQDVLH